MSKNYENPMENIWHKLQAEFQRFCKKNNFSSVVLGLSGGIDSALCAVLAADALCGENVTALMMRTKYTSPLSVDIAREIAGLNRLNYHELDIQETIDREIDFLTQAFGENLQPLVIENLQARERGKILMAWSNQFGGVVLACGNKSEASTGYCTLYGDTCGALMPIGNLFKTEVFELARWRNAQNRVLPQEVIVRAPSAELSLNQKDENSLPPYPILDGILKLYLIQQKSEAEIIRDGFDPQIVKWVISRYQQTGFKRQQMAPALAIA